LATQPIPEAEQIVYIPLTDIKPSKTNPRSEIDDKELEELAANISASRVHEPILVRPLSDGKGKYALVFGERRYWASIRAKKETIPSMVREMTDEEAEDAQITENLQRADLHPLDDAAVFKRLYDRQFKESRRHDNAIAHVVARVHKDASFIARYLKLNDLLPAAKEAFRQNHILLGHALELCRLREEEQKKALQWMLDNYEEARTERGWVKHRMIPSVEQLRLWVRENLFLDLSKAPFDTGDPALNRKMGPCTDCKFRSGNQPALFGDVKKGDICTVPSCWSAKHNTTILLQAKAVAKELGVDSVVKVGIGYASWNHAKVPVDTYVEYSSEARLVKQGQECKNTKPGVVTFVAESGSEKVGDRVLVCRKALSCPKHKHEDSRSPRPKKSYDQMASVRIANLRHEIPQRVRAALIRAVLQAAQNEHRTLSTHDKKKFGLLAKQMHCDLFFDRHRDLCKLLGAEPATDKNRGKDWRRTSAQLFAGKPVALMVAMTLMHRYHVGSYDTSADPLKLLLPVYRVNAAKVEKKTRAAIDNKIAEIRGALRRRRERLAKSSSKPPAQAEKAAATMKRE
jgi:ParB/RepB/Spo0J family partition protein